MIFFPLSLIAGFFVARRWTLVGALLIASALFILAIVVAWKVQGFVPSARDLLWLMLAWTLAVFGYWRRTRTAASTRRAFFRLRHAGHGHERQEQSG